MEYSVADPQKRDITYNCLFDFYAMYQPNEEKAEMFFKKIKINNKVEDEPESLLLEAYYAYIVKHDVEKAKEYVPRILSKVNSFEILTSIEKDIIRDRAQVLIMHINEMG